MAVHGLGHTLVIANPVAHSGKGAQATQLVRRFFESFSNATTSFDLEMTRSMNDAVEIAAHAGGMDTVIALGGDGIIHEVVNGLMAIDDRDRPTLGIIPMGTGNDFARSIHQTFNNPEASLRELLNGTVRTIDLGLVSSDLFPEGPVPGSEGTFFMETLSFGMDAAIAIDTTHRRAAGTTTEGSALFMTSTLKVALAGAAGYPCHVSIDGEELDTTDMDLTEIEDVGSYALVISDADSEYQLLSFTIVPEKTGMISRPENTSKTRFIDPAS